MAPSPTAGSVNKEYTPRCARDSFLTLGTPGRPRRTLPGREKRRTWRQTQPEVPPAASPTTGSVNKEYTPRCARDSFLTLGTPGRPRRTLPGRERAPNVAPDPP